MYNWGYFVYDFAVSRITSYPRAFLQWQVHLFESQYKCIAEKWFLSFFKRPGQKHIFIGCLKYTGHLLFIYFGEPRQSRAKFSFSHFRTVYDHNAYCCFPCCEMVFSHFFLNFLVIIRKIHKVSDTFTDRIITIRQYDFTCPRLLTGSRKFVL